MNRVWEVKISTLQLGEEVSTFVGNSATFKDAIESAIEEYVKDEWVYPGRHLREDVDLDDISTINITGIRRSFGNEA
tara:strand:- start:125 stop:355 length:231 start_codon:yes stop_codon:yes gene_type:complete